MALVRALLEAKVAAYAFASDDDDIGAVARQCRFVPARRLGVAATVPGAKIRSALSALF